jgi:hypothetical protein
MFAAASQKASENMAAAFRQQAIQEFQAEVAPQFIDALKQHPMQLVGMEVPDVRHGAAQGAMMRIRDTAEAKDWQEATGQLINAELDDRVAQKQDGVRETVSIIQESYLLFQNNPDLIPGTKQFDPELGARFTEMAKDYEFRTGDKLYGYTVNVQPLVNSIRASLERERGANGQRQEDRAAQQRAAAAAQQREDNGQFSAPQAGIPSTAQRGGEASDETDFSTFWSGVGMPNINL